MRRFYQESWQGIPFSAFTHVSFFHLASSKFYASFYEELFRRCFAWECLPSAWRAGKDKDAQWLAQQITAQREKMLAYTATPLQDCTQSAVDATADNLVEAEKSTNGIDTSPQHHDEEYEASAENSEEFFASKAQIVHTMHPENPIRVLSIGRGVGYLEKSLLDVMPHIELHVNEPTTAGLRLLRECVPVERIYIGSPSTCLPPDVQYDVIYLSAVDYSIANDELAFAMRELRGQLLPGGRIICISASLLEEDSIIGRLVNAFKIGVRAVLHFFDLRRQQFWGWRRTREEYHAFFNECGLENIQDGWLDDGFNSYWISGEENNCS